MMITFSEDDKLLSQTLRLFYFLSGKIHNSSCQFLTSQDVFSIFQTIFTFSDKLFLQFLGFALIDGIFRMSLVYRYAAALQRGQLHFSRMLLVHRPGSSQADVHFLLSVF